MADFDIIELIHSEFGHFQVPKLCDHENYLKSTQSTENVSIIDLKSDSRKTSTAERKNLPKKAPTVCVPFRCAQPIIKTYSRACKEIDERRLEKQKEDESHLNIKFTAKGVPKTNRNPEIFKPKPLKHKVTVKEFSFVKRDIAMKKAFQKQVQLQRTLAIKNAKKLTIFKAKPCPKLDTSEVERQKEQAEYRKIIRIMRAKSISFYQNFFKM